MVEFLAYVYAVIILLVASALSAVIMYAVLRLFSLTDFAADLFYSVKETVRELWRLITGE